MQLIGFRQQVAQSERGGAAFPDGEARATRFRIPRGTYYLPLQQEFFRFHKTQS